MKANHTTYKEGEFGRHVQSCTWCVSVIGQFCEEGQRLQNEFLGVEKEESWESVADDLIGIGRDSMQPMKDIPEYLKERFISRAEVKEVIGKYKIPKEADSFPMWGKTIVNAVVDDILTRLNLNKE